jgi:hypothetical protein
MRPSRLSAFGTALSPSCRGFRFITANLARQYRQNTTESHNRHFTEPNISGRVSPKVPVGGAKALVCVTLRGSSNPNALHFASFVCFPTPTLNLQTANTQQSQVPIPQECQFEGDCAPWLSASHSKNDRTSSRRQIRKVLIRGKCNCVETFIQSQGANTSHPSPMIQSFLGWKNAWK